MATCLLDPEGAGAEAARARRVMAYSRAIVQLGNNVADRHIDGPKVKQANGAVAGGGDVGARTEYEGPSGSI